MTIRLGFAPVELNVVLTGGSDFASSLVADSPWADGTVIALVFTTATGPVTWTATINGVSAGWQVVSSEVDGLLAQPVRLVKLMYSDPDTTLTWATGTVSSR